MNTQRGFFSCKEHAKFLTFGEVYFANEPTQEEMDRIIEELNNHSETISYEISSALKEGACGRGGHERIIKHLMRRHTIPIA